MLFYVSRSGWWRQAPGAFRACLAALTFLLAVVGLSLSSPAPASAAAHTPGLCHSYDAVATVALLETLSTATGVVARNEVVATRAVHAASPDGAAVPAQPAAGGVYDSPVSFVAPRATFSNLDPSDVPRVNGFQAINPNSLSNASGRFNYAVLDDGSLVVANRRHGHIDLANGGDVLAAGEVHIVNGQIRSVNNASGHYRPSGSSAQTAAENAFHDLDLDVAPGAYREIGG